MSGGFGGAFSLADTIARIGHFILSHGWESGGYHCHERETGRLLGDEHVTTFTTMTTE